MMIYLEMDEGLAQHVDTHLHVKVQAWLVIDALKGEL